MKSPVLLFVGGIAIFAAGLFVGTNLKGQLLSTENETATVIDNGTDIAPLAGTDEEEPPCGGTPPMCSGHCSSWGPPDAVCQSIRIDSRNFVCACDYPPPENPCGGEPGSCSGDCVRENEVCRTLTDDDGTQYCTCFWEPQGTCGGEPDACSGDCPVTRSCQTLVNEATGEQYCGCGHWSWDPRYDCDEKDENTCGEGTCPEGEECGPTYRLPDGSFAGCGCSKPSQEPPRPAGDLVE